jgi:hypothetical protein
MNDVALLRDTFLSELCFELGCGVRCGNLEWSIWAMVFKWITDMIATLYYREIGCGHVIERR